MAAGCGSYRKEGGAAIQCPKELRPVFTLGVGGSAGNASHTVNDFRKIVGIEAYAPKRADNVSELTARMNDEGRLTVFEAWLRAGPPSTNN